jgi:hypothetical protein
MCVQISYLRGVHQLAGEHRLGGPLGQVGRRVPTGRATTFGEATGAVRADHGPAVIAIALDSLCLDPESDLEIVIARVAVEVGDEGFAGRVPAGVTRQAYPR